jgi:DNA-binding NarL/FixJ family response regulator
MHQTQIVTYGVEGVLAERLKELAQARRCWLRETNQLAACQNLVQTSPPSVFILRLGRDLERELAMLERVHACLPATAIVVIGEADNPVLAGLVWELGATFALFPPMPVEMITDVVSSILSGEKP